MSRSAPHRFTAARRGLLGAGVAVALAAAGLPAAAQAATTCSYNATTATVTIAMSASGDTAKVGRTAAGAITSGAAACGAATVTNTNTIRLTGGDSGQEAQIDLANGPLGPGKTAEASGTSEIEIVASLGAGYDGVHVLGSAGIDTVRVGTLGATLNADTDVDVNYSGVDAWELYGKASNDILSLGGSAPTGDPIARDGEIYAGAGNDTITGGRDGDYLYGDTDAYNGAAIGVGIDTINGGDGNDTLAAQAGDDKLFGEEGGDTIYLDLGTDTVDGGDGGDYFEAPNGAGAAADGADAVKGGEGNDRLWLGQRTGNLVITLDNVANDGVDTSAPANGTAEEGDNYGADIESVTTGTGNDRVSADTVAANAAQASNSFDGGNGNDVLKGGTGTDYLDGDNGTDELTGNDGNDSLYGGPDADKVIAGNGADDITAGTGADQVSGDAGNDRIYEESTADGADTIAGGTGRDFASFSNRSTNVRLTLDNLANDGSDANQDGIAEEKDNVKADVEDLRSGTGNDYLSADTTAANATGAGNRFDAGTNNDILLGGAGEDDLYGDDGNDQLTGGIGEDFLSGDRGADKFTARDDYWDNIDGGFDSDTDTIVNADPSDSRVRVP